MNTTPAKTNRHEFLIMTLIIIIASLIPFSTDSYTPSLPFIAQYFGVSSHKIQLTITLFLLGLAFGQLIYGPLSDRFGRRPLILLGIFICFTGSLLCSFATSPTWLIAARFIQGIGAGSANVLYRAVVRDTFSGVRMAKMSSYLGMVFTLVLAGAPIIGGYIQSFFGWRANFIFVTLFCGISFFLLMKLLPETNQALDKNSTRLSVSLKNYWRLITHPTFVSYTLCAGLAFSGLITYYAITPFLFQNVIGLSPTEYGWLSIFLASAQMIGLSINVRYLAKYSSDTMLAIGILLMVSSGTSMFIAGILFPIGTFIVMLPAIVFVIGAGLVFANAMAGAFEPFGEIAGTAGAMYGCLQVLTAFLTSLLVASFHSKTQMPMAMIYMILGMSSATLFYFFIRKKNLSINYTPSL